MQKTNSSDNSWFIMGIFLTLVILVGCTISQQGMPGSENTDAITNEAAEIATTPTLQTRRFLHHPQQHW